MYLHAARAAHGRPRWRQWATGLFPPPARPGLGAPWWRRATPCGAALLARVALVRQSGVPATDTAWAEDAKVFYAQALTTPFGRALFKTYDGYAQLVPRLLAQVARWAPPGRAAEVFAVAGAIGFALTACLVFHMARGHIGPAPVRVLLVAAMALLPIATAELLDNMVNLPWWLFFAAFWGLLWRPRTIAGMVVAGAVCFLATASEPLVALFVPLAAGARLGPAPAPRARRHRRARGWPRLPGHRPFGVGRKGLHPGRPPRHRAGLRGAGRAFGLGRHEGGGLADGAQCHRRCRPRGRRRRRRRRRRADSPRPGRPLLHCRRGRVLRRLFRSPDLAAGGQCVVDDQPSGRGQSLPGRSPAPAHQHRHGRGRPPRPPRPGRARSIPAAPAPGTPRPGRHHWRAGQAAARRPPSSSAPCCSCLPGWPTSGTPTCARRARRGRSRWPGPWPAAGTAMPAPAPS